MWEPDCPRSSAASTTPAGAASPVDLASLERDVWHDVASASLLSELLVRLLGRVAGILPVDSVFLRRFLPGLTHVETIASAQRSPSAPAAGVPQPDAVPVPPQAVAALEDGTVLIGHSVSPTDPVAAFLPSGASGSFAVVPLRDQGRPLAVVVFLGSPAGTLTTEHIKIFDSLTPPLLSVVLRDAERRGEDSPASGRPRAPLEGDEPKIRFVSDAFLTNLKGLSAVMGLVTRVAPSDAPVLVLGETGVGKEVIARAIHERSPRQGGPWIKVNCGAIPPELVDSELFGHERGSFTGAIATRKGWFERADQGTLFLDEIGELPLAAQVRLLRVLQDGTFERVGAQRTQTVNVRVIAATHRDLSSMVKSGRFRRDLWYRLSIFPLQVPALRDRKDDIPALAAHFAGRAGGTPLVPSEQDLTYLLNYGWPGNVRELGAVIERAALLGGGRTLCVAEALDVSAREHQTPPPETQVAPPSEATQVRTLDVVMIEHIERALAATGGRIEGSRGAAALLGINPHTLRAKMRKLRIDWTRFRHRQRRTESQ